MAVTILIITPLNSAFYKAPLSGLNGPHRVHSLTSSSQVDNRNLEPPVTQGTKRGTGGRALGGQAGGAEVGGGGPPVPPMYGPAPAGPPGSMYGPIMGGWLTGVGGGNPLKNFRQYGGELRVLRVETQIKPLILNP